ncbi:hypothetical protein [Moorena producens]
MHPNQATKQPSTFNLQPNNLQPSTFNQTTLNLGQRPRYANNIDIPE